MLENRLRGLLSWFDQSIGEYLYKVVIGVSTGLSVTVVLAINDQTNLRALILLFIAWLLALIPVFLIIGINRWKDKLFSCIKSSAIKAKKSSSSPEGRKLEQYVENAIPGIFSAASVSLGVSLTEKIENTIGAAYLITLVLFPLIILGFFILDAGKADKRKKIPMVLAILEIVGFGIMLEPHIEQIIIASYDSVVGVP